MPSCYDTAKAPRVSYQKFPTLEEYKLYISAQTTSGKNNNKGCVCVCVCVAIREKSEGLYYSRLM